MTDSFTQECKVKAFDRSGKALNVSVIPSTVKVDCSLSNYSKTVPLVPEYTGNVANGYAIDQMTFSKDKFSSVLIFFVCPFFGFSYLIVITDSGLSGAFIKKDLSLSML